MLLNIYPGQAYTPSKGGGEEFEYYINKLVYSILTKNGSFIGFSGYESYINVSTAHSDERDSYLQFEPDQVRKHHEIRFNRYSLLQQVEQGSNIFKVKYSNYINFNNIEKYINNSNFEINKDKQTITIDPTFLVYEKLRRK